jgi:hypothetical protein
MMAFVDNLCLLGGHETAPVDRGLDLVAAVSSYFRQAGEQVQEHGTVTGIIAGNPGSPTISRHSRSAATRGAG